MQVVWVGWVRVQAVEKQGLGTSLLQEMGRQDERLIGAMHPCPCLTSPPL